MSEINKKIVDGILSDAQSGDDAYLENAVKNFRQYVEIIASKYSDSPMERDDIIQEGMIGLLSAIRTYDSARGASFRTYANTCIDNSIQSALRKYHRLKDIPVQNFIEYDDGDISSGGDCDSAEDIFIAQESVSLLTKVLQENLSDFENEVLGLYIVGCSYNEMADRLGKTPKAIDNALQRIRRKLSDISL